LALRVDMGMVKDGAQKGLKSTIELAKIVVPTTIVVTILRASGLLDIVSGLCASFMSLFGLSGDAALVLISGYLVNLYAATGVIVALQLPLREITILAVMLGFAHSLLIEIMISKRAGSRISVILPLRVGASLLAGMILGGLL